MKKALLIAVTLVTFAGLSGAQTSVSQEVTALGSFGLASSDQSIDSGEAGAYAYQKNGTSTNVNVTFTSKVPYFYDLAVKLNSKGRIGSGYVPLQLVPASAQSFAITVDSAWGRLNALTIVGLADPFDLYVMAGKYQSSASNLHRVTLYGTESVLNMVKTANTLNTGVELTYKVIDPEAAPGSVPTMVSVQAVSALVSDEGVPRLYDTDGSQSNHGKAVIGKYAPQLFANVKLTNFALPFGTLAAEGVYAMNGAGIYSGNSAGLSALVTTTLVPDLITLPVGLGLAYYEKNIDVLSGSIGTDIADKTVDFRDALRLGLGAGFRYLVPDELGIDANLGASFTQLSHIYRDPITLMGLSLDGKVTLAGSYFVGCGAIVGTISDVVWKTKADVASIYDDYRKTFKMAENLGYEAYAGLNLGTKGSLVLGINNNKGLAMNYGLESLRDGEYKFRQKGTASADKLYETSAVYLKATFKL